MSTTDWLVVFGFMFTWLLLLGRCKLENDDTSKICHGLSKKDEKRLYDAVQKVKEK